MDIATPTGSEITSVDFGFLNTKDIKNLSVKQITSPEVFDSLGHPISGGLYDLALGAFLKNLCVTCGLDDRFCPGHMGHIELPIPVYNPMFFSQLYVLLRSSCLYCHRFKLRATEVNRFECKLRLLQFGLVFESLELDNIRIGDVEDSEAEEEGVGNNGPSDKDVEDLIRRRNQYVNKAIAKAIAEGRSPSTGVQTSSVLETRKQVIHEFYKRLLSRPKCDNCGMFSPSFRKDGFSKIFETALKEKQLTNNRAKGLQRQDMVFERKPAKDGEVDEISLPAPKSKDASRYVLSTEVRNILRAVFAREHRICRVVFQMRPDSKEEVSADMFFIHYVVVPPTRFRLPSQLGDEIHANTQNDLLSKVLTTALRIRDLNEQMAHFRANKIGGEERKNVFNQLMNSFVTIQNDVNGFIDAAKNQNNPAGRVPTPGIKQVLEKKEGLFRKNMMGKRVNYAARSVISPDPNLETSEVGVPPVFAIKLTYPEPVTTYNFHELRKAVVNGPYTWPGATQIQNEDGTMVSLHGMTVEQRTALANQLLTPSTNSVGSVVNKKVFRHIRNQDVVLMNRQPTLHKASMMGHKVRVLPGEKTIRLHYANTGAYNADFDGDEMNMHFPQNENARAEAFLLANTDSQYLTPTSGKPLRGLIQDHISAGVWLTNKDTFFTREQYQQLIYGSIRPEDGHTTSPRIKTVPPAIFKPVPLWTGKQVITTCLLNITPEGRPGLNLKSKNKIKNEYWGEGSRENEVIFKNGALINGILDKSQYGASDHGLVHSIHEIYGPTSAGMLLSVLGRLFTKYIMIIGFTCGMEDLHLTAEGNKWRREILDSAIDVGRKAAVEVANLPEDTKNTNPVLLERLEEILRDDGKLAVLDAISQSKVNAVTTSVVSKCIPEGTAKRFPENNMQAMALSGAKGSNVNVSQIMCMLGQQALEGRRVPVMVSGKTLPSFKPFETAARAGGYISGRFFSGIKPQEYYFHCMAGREGLIDTAVKTARSGYLQRCLIKQLEGVHTNYDNTVRDSDGTLVQFLYGGDAIDVTRESHLREFDFCSNNYDALIRKHSTSQFGHMDTESAISYAKKVKKHLKRHADDPHYLHPNKYDPVLSQYNPSRYLGSVSERFLNELDDFIAKNPQIFPSKKDTTNSGISEKKFRALMQLKYMQSVVDPGESVGIIASQSIGEPSTQMTLNTFHFAGHGAANVTLGIPRMREIIMTASAQIKTPQMTLPLMEQITDEQADVFCRSVARVVLSEVIDQVTVTERTGLTADGSSSRSYKVRMQFYTADEYFREHDVSKEYLEQVITKSFLAELESVIKKELRKQKRGTASAPRVGEAVPANETEMGAKDSTGAATSESRDDDSDDDIDEDDEQARAKTKQAVSYDNPDADEIEAMEKAEKSSDEDLDSDEEDSSSSDSDPDSDVEMDDASSKPKLTGKAKERQADVITTHHNIREFNFDDEDGEWCEFTLEYPAETKKLLMVNIIEQLCRKHVVREIPRIGRCLRPDKTQRKLITEGVNFKAMWEEDLVVDVNGILSNDVTAVLKTYGVEAARNTVVREINSVFETYAITVNLRHLDLIADMMTREGTYLAFNRQGVDSSTSPLMKMSFETTCQFLTKAVLDGDNDDLESPSARIVTGKISKFGTGSFDLFNRVN
ncbi:DNA-directed RNA polymerase I subunit Rpa190p [Trichomonascus vanleenenianus]|uniref:DNA-directed RNA polymerase I core subunit RPA190 n=1 Tax=Trichomonascus vanleenenianus TaxID=2268995 RepID=UPI003EC96EE1